jgi:penicillin-binding protein 1A
LEYKFNKDQILALYMNRVYLGSGVYGIEAASNKYFQKSSNDLNLREAAILAGMLKAPSRYNPIASMKLANERANVVWHRGYPGSDRKRKGKTQEKTQLSHSQQWRTPTLSRFFSLIFL